MHISHNKNNSGKINSPYFYKILLVLCLFSFLISFFCNKAFFETFLSPDGHIVDPLYLAYISLLRLVLIAISSVMLCLCLLRKPLVRDWKVSVVKLKNARGKKMSMPEMFAQPPFLLRVVSISILSMWILFMVYSFHFHRAFLEKLATTENGITETLTVIFCLLASILAVVRILYCSSRDIKLGMQKWCLILAALFFVVVAMEEINWGQTYFRYKTPDMLSEVNVQQEVSLHNIPLPTEEDWAKLVLHVLAASIGIIIPALLWLSPPFARIFWAFGVPLPSRAAQTGFIIATLIPTDKFARSLNLFARVNTLSELREVTCAASFFILMWHLYYASKKALGNTKEFSYPGGKL